MPEQNSVPAAGSKRSLLILAGSVLVSIFWICSSQLNMYHFAVTGALAEMAWFPMIALTLLLAVLASVYWYKQQFRLQSFYLLSLLLIAGTCILVAML